MNETRKLAIFDLDNTLYDDIYAVRNAMEVLKYDLQIPDDISIDAMFNIYYGDFSVLYQRYLAGELTAYETKTERMRQFLEAFGVRPEQEELREITKRFDYLHILFGRPIPGARELLKIVNETIPVAIVTNHIGEIQKKKIDKIGITDFMDLLIPAYDVRIFKPQREIFELALKKFNCQPSEAVVVGDSWKHDVLGALNAGIRPLWYNGRNRTIPDQSLAEEIKSYLPVEDVARLIIDGSSSPA